MKAIAFLAVALALALAGCATTSQPPEPRVITQRVEVPVPVPCVVNVPEPDWADSDAKLQAAPDVFARVQLLVAGRLQHYAYEAELRAAHKACSAG